MFNPIIAICHFIYLVRTYRYTIIYFALPFLLSLIMLIALFMVIPLNYIYSAFIFLDSSNFLLLTLCASVVCTTVHCFVRFLRPFVCISAIERFHNDLVRNGHVSIYEGQPGTGKTLTMTYAGVYLASIAWYRLCQKHFINQAILRDLKRSSALSVDELKAIDSVRKSYEYWVSHTDKIPMLLSNIPIEQNGRYSSKLKYEHFLGTECIPEASVLLYDEGADTLSSQRSRSKRDSIEGQENAIISSILSKERHYGDWYILLTEQDAAELLISVRRVVSLNRYLNTMHKVCEPAFLQWLLERMLNKVMRRGESLNSRYAARVLKLCALIDKIGFLKIHYEDRGNLEHNKNIVKAGYYCLPKHLPYRYVSRCFQHQYPAKDIDIALETYTSLYV